MHKFSQTKTIMYLDSAAIILKKNYNVQLQNILIIVLKLLLFKSNMICVCLFQGILLPAEPIWMVFLYCVASQFPWEVLL